MPFSSLRRLWAGLALLHAALLVHLAVYAVQPGRLESRAFVTLAGALGLFALAVIGAAVALNTRRLAALRALAGRWPRLYLPAALAVMLAFGLGLRPEWLYAHAALALAAAFALGYVTLVETPAPLRRVAWLAFVAALFVAAITLLRAAALSSYPPRHVIDEPWILGWAYSYLRIGSPLDWIMLGADQGAAFYLPRLPGLMAAWLSVVGVGFWEARLFSFLLLMAAIPLTAAGAASLYGRATGWLTAAVLFASAALLNGARIRHDAGLALALALSFWLFSQAVKREKPALHFIAGLVVGLGLLSQYNAVGLGPALLVGLYLPRYLARWRSGTRLPEAGFWLYALGGALGGLAAASVMVLPDLAVFTGRLPPRSPQSFAQWAETFAAHLGTLAETSRLETALIAAGLAAALYRRDWTPALTVVCGLLALSLLAVVVADYYHVPLAPFYGLLIARLFAAGLSRVPQPTFSYSRAAAAALFLAAGLGATLAAPLDHLRGGEPLRPPPPPAAAWVQENIPPGETVLSENLYFLWLTDYRFASILTPDHLIGTPAREGYAADPAAFWDNLGVQVIISDPSLPSYDRFERLFAGGYLDSRGFAAAARFGDVVVYRRE